jgi:hypothetical protein
MVGEFRRAGFEVVTPLNPRLCHLAPWLDAQVCYSVKDAVNRKPDVAVVIAPEGELEPISTSLEEKGIRVLGSPPESIRISADKWLTYLALRAKVPQPLTWEKRPNREGRILVKPINGVGCEGIAFLRKRSSEKVIFQEFLEGTHASCCLLIGKSGGVALSVNRQEISITEGGFEYLGGEVPLSNGSVEECTGVCLHAGRLLGLRGFCGVDVVIRDHPYVVDVNPRLTTSFVALAKIARANLAELLVDVLLNGSPARQVPIEGHATFRLLKTKQSFEMTKSCLDGLLEVPGLIAPPTAFNRRIRKGTPMLILGEGKNRERARRDLAKTVGEISATLGVEVNAFDRP